MVGRYYSSKSSGLAPVARKMASKFEGLRHTILYVIMDEKYIDFPTKILHYSANLVVPRHNFTGDFAK